MIQFGGEMGYRKITRADAKTATRNRTMVVEGLKEYRKIQEDLAAGLKRNEGVEVTFTPEQRESLGIKTLRRSFRAALQAYIAKENLAHHSVVTFVTDGVDIIQVWNDQPVAAKRAS